MGHGAGFGLPNRWKGDRAQVVYLPHRSRLRLGAAQPFQTRGVGVFPPRRLGS